MPQATPSNATELEAPNRTALVLMAHPDDAEFLCGGTLALLADRGWKIHIASATAGDCGTAQLSREAISSLRRAEGARAAAVIGGSYSCLEQHDLQVFYEREFLVAACGLLREVQPHVVLTHSPSDYMLDHEETSRVARAASFNAPIPNAPAPPGAAPLGAIPHLYYADPAEGKDAMGRAVVPDILVDIQSVEERKLEMLAQHESQREWLRAHHGMDEYLESCKRWSRSRAAEFGLVTAEGFRQHRGHAYPSDDLLAAELGELCHRPSAQS